MCNDGIMAVIFVTLLGFFVGSFLDVVIDRLPRSESFLKGRSYCESCKHVLGTRDLIPLVSFVLLRGRCRYCHVPLSYQYPLLELTTGLLFAITYLSLRFSSYPELAYNLFIISALIVVFFVDLQHGIIPFKIVVPSIVIVLTFLLFTNPSLLVTHLITGFAVMFFFFLLFAGTKGKGMGFGDVVYAFFMGLLLGFPESVIGLYIAFLTGAVISLILVVLKRKRLRGSTIPFGPFLVAGTYIAFVWGNIITVQLLKVI